MLTERAPAKLNLALHLRRRRDDGYHDLETIFAFTEFGDTLSAEASDSLTLQVAGPFAGAAGEGGDNLVLRAARALAGASGKTAGARLVFIRAALVRCALIRSGLKARAT